MKEMAFLLALVLALSLCLGGCGQAERYSEIADLLDSGNYDAAIQKIEAMKPTEPETTVDPATNPDLIKLYEEEFKQVVEHLESGYSWSSLSLLVDEGGNRYYRDEIEKGRWVYETAQKLAPYYPDATAIADRFVLVENALLYWSGWSEDSLGNVNKHLGHTLTYHPDGTLVYVPDYQEFYAPADKYPSAYGTPEYTYDDAGRLIMLRYLDKDFIRSVINYTYNENGDLISEHYLDHRGEEFTITYELNEHGLPVRAEGYPHDRLYSSVAYFTYDDQNHLIRIYSEIGSDEEYTRVGETTDYVYDENGHRISIRYYATSYRNGKPDHYFQVAVWNYTYDESGKIIQHAYYNYGNFTADGTYVHDKLPNPVIAEYSYGTYYCYTPAE